MKREYLEEALQEISDEHIAEAVEESAEEVRNDETVSGVEDVLRSGCGNAESGKRRTSNRRTSGRTRSGKKKSGWKPVIALVTAAAVLLVVVFGGGQWWNAGENDMSDSVLKAYAVGEAEYPELVQYGEAGWYDSVLAQKRQPEGYNDGLSEFSALTIPMFLSGAGEENVVYSPMSAYLALAMMAEITDGDSRQQILDVLGVDEIDTLRAKASSIWNANYLDDGLSASILAGSLWLDDSVNYRQDAVDQLAQNYYASTYQGDMASGEVTGLMKRWLSGQTGGMLEEQVEQISLPSETLLSLISTVYLQDEWQDEFEDELNEVGVFYSPSGEVECEFMYECKRPGTYYYGDQFGAVSKSLKGSGTMWFILSDEGVDVDELLEDDELYEFLTGDIIWTWEKQVGKVIHFYLPKFDVSSDLNLTGGLQKLGVMEVFGPEADFTALSDNISKLSGDLGSGVIEQAARVTVDEKGVAAAAYTNILYAGAALPPDEEIEFKLNRPFIFMITGTDNEILMIGVVNQP